MSAGRATAVAHANIALAKYWGKADQGLNLTAVPSLSLTLAALTSTTRVELLPDAERDEIALDQKPAAGRPRERVVAALDRVRELAGTRVKARVHSSNDFPTAAGLASSASGFAALVLAAFGAYGIALDLGRASALARQASASAARSLFGGFVALPARAEAAERLLAPDAFPLCMVIAVTASGPKVIGSTEGMDHTARTSPYYGAWLEHAPGVYDAVRAAVLAKDLEALGPAVERSALMMHASMFAADPGIVYFVPATLAAMQAVRELRARGTPAFFTMDAGPHVKVLARPEDVEAVRNALAAVPGVSSVLVSGAGGDARIVED